MPTETTIHQQISPLASPREGFHFPLPLPNPKEDLLDLGSKSKNHNQPSKLFLSPFYHLLFLSGKIPGGKGESGHSDREITPQSRERPGKRRPHENRRGCVWKRKHTQKARKETFSIFSFYSLNPRRKRALPTSGFEARLFIHIHF